MLVLFRFKNFGPFMEEVTLDMRAVKAYKEHQYNLILENDDNSFLKVVSIFGANASGKSNFIDAYTTFQKIARYSFQENNKDKKEPICFAIDGTWGQGKSWLVEKIEAKLKGINIENQYSKNDLVKYIPKDFFVFKYNAWEMDYYDDPLIGIILTLCEQLNNLSTLTLSKAIN